MLNRRVAGLLLMFSLVVTPSMTANADTVSATITVGSFPSGVSGVAINPAGTFAYVTNRNSYSVSKINLATDTVVATITVGNNPWGVAINPAGTFAYVTNGSSGSVSKINLATDTVVATITVGGGPYGVAINPAGTFAYVTTSGSDSVSKINLATDTVDATITVGNNPRGVAINPAGTFAYVTNLGSGSVSKINLATDTVVATITVGSEPYGVAINPAGTFAYVTNGSSGSVSKINLATNTVVATITVGIGPRGVAINPAGTYVYVTNSGSDSVSSSVSKINLATDTVAATITVGYNPWGVAINPAGTFAYVTINRYSGSVSKINLISSEPQSISFTAVSPQLLGAKTVALSATASSALTVAFTSETPNVCTVTGSIVTLLMTGTCTIKSNQSGGSGWEAAPEVLRSFTILPSPPAGEVGVSIFDGSAYTNTKAVKLNLVWPEYATEARISNDGGFAASKTKVVSLGASVDWDLDDSVKGIYTKVVYVRFNGSGIDTTKTYSDDIILDTAAPVVESSSVASSGNSVELSLKATDDISGVDKVEIASDAKTVQKDYATKVTVPASDLGLSVGSSAIKTLAVSTVRFRVRDAAGNWTTWQSLSLGSASQTSSKLSLSVNSARSTTSILSQAGVKRPAGGSVKVTTTSKSCRVVGSRVLATKAGTCTLQVRVTTAAKKVSLKTVRLTVSSK